MPDYARRALRTLAQFVVAGGLTGLADQLAGDLPAAWTPVLLAVAQLVVTAAQNWLEDHGHLTLPGPLAKT